MTSTTKTTIDRESCTITFHRRISASREDEIEPSRRMLRRIAISRSITSMEALVGAIATAKARQARGLLSTIACSALRARQHRGSLGGTSLRGFAATIGPKCVSSLCSTASTSPCGTLPPSLPYATTSSSLSIA